MIDGTRPQWAASDRLCHLPSPEAIWQDQWDYSSGVCVGICRAADTNNNATAAAPPPRWRPRGPPACVRELADRVRKKSLSLAEFVEAPDRGRDRAMTRRIMRSPRHRRESPTEMARPGAAGRRAPGAQPADALHRRLRARRVGAPLLHAHGRRVYRARLGRARLERGTEVRRVLAAGGGGG